MANISLYIMSKYYERTLVLAFINLVYSVNHSLRMNVRQKQGLNVILGLKYQSLEPVLSKNYEHLLGLLINSYNTFDLLL